MQVSVKKISPTRVNLVITVSAGEMKHVKTHVIEKHFADKVTIAGFRAGKAPLELIEKQVNQQQLTTEVLEHAVNDYYGKAVSEQRLRPTSNPEVKISKFVPYTELVFEAETDIIGDIKLPDYTKISVPRQPIAVDKESVQQVIDNLRQQQSQKNDVERAAKNGDQVWIDFSGADAKGNPIKNADGKDYPLALGSNTFIPGFEDNLVGLKAGDKKSFELTFPEDYNAKELQGKKVTFTVTVNKVQEVVLPEVTDEFAASVAPVSTVEELKADIEKQLKIEHERQAQTNQENQLIQAIANQTTIEIPPALIDQQVLSMEEEEKRNLTYRGQTWQEHLDQENQTEQQHRDSKKPEAEQRIKVSIILSEIAEREQITVSPEELEIRIQVLKAQYQDAQMQVELDKPENRRELESRLLAEKTIAKLLTP